MLAANFDELGADTMDTSSPLSLCLFPLWAKTLENGLSELADDEVMYNERTEGGRKSEDVGILDDSSKAT